MSIFTIKSTGAKYDPVVIDYQFPSGIGGIGISKKSSDSFEDGKPGPFLACMDSKREWFGDERPPARPDSPSKPSPPKPSPPPSKGDGETEPPKSEPKKGAEKAGLLLIAGGVAYIAATLLEDVFTGGVGIADDAITIPQGLAMIAAGL